MGRRVLVPALVGLVLAVPVAGCGAGSEPLTPPAGVSSPDAARGTAARLSDPPLPAPAAPSFPAGTSPPLQGALIPPGGPVVDLTVASAQAPAAPVLPVPTPGPTFDRGAPARPGPP